jgi:hypothetical protein
MTPTATVPESWKGKVVYVYLRGGGGASLHTGIAMKDVRFQTVNDRVFLAGSALSDPSDWVADLPLLVLWEEVIHIVVVDSPEDYFSRSQRARALLAHASTSDDDTPQ